MLKFSSVELIDRSGREAPAIIENETVASNVESGARSNDLGSGPGLAKSSGRSLDCGVKEEVDMRTVAANPNDQDLVDRVFSWLPEEVVEEIPLDSVPLVHNSITGSRRVLWLIPLPDFDPDIHERPVFHRRDVLVVVHKKEGGDFFSLLRRDHRSWKYAPDDDQGQEGAPNERGDMEFKGHPYKLLKMLDASMCVNRNSL